MHSKRIKLSVEADEATYIGGNWAANARPGRYFIVWNTGDSLSQVGSFIVPVGMEGTFAARLTLPRGTYVLGAIGEAGSIGVYSGKYTLGNAGDGWSLDIPDAVLTRNLIAMNAPPGA